MKTNLATIEFAKKVLLILAAVCFVMGLMFSGCSTMPTKNWATEDFTTIKWPDSELAAKIPVPESLYGEISHDSIDSLLVKIGNTSQEQYDAYVDACREKGFTEDYYRSSTSYRAEDASGYELSLTYHKDDKYMSIDLDEPLSDPIDSVADALNEVDATDESAQSADAGQSAPETQADVPVNGIRPSFKEAMDSFESFINEYCDFMESYSESDNTASMMADYLEFIEEYDEAMDKMDAIDEGSLSPEEDAYYLEVMTRCNQKLTETAQAMS